MKLGIIAGGFKPFTSGHFSLLLSAMSRSDRVIIFYGLAGRKKGSGYNYTREMSLDIFQIMQRAIERETQGKVTVILGKPTPIVKVFEVIEAVKDQNDSKGILTKAGIQPSEVDKINVYSGEEDLVKYTKHIGGPKEEKYFGDLAQEGKLNFVPVDSANEDSDLSDILDIAKEAYGGLSSEEITDRLRMRGSVFRSMINHDSAEKLKRYLPPFLTSDESSQIVSILLRGLNESPLRAYIKSILVTG